MWLSDTQKVGVAISSFGILFIGGGVVLFFDSGLLALGNLLFLLGLVFVIGLQKTKSFFFRRDKWRGSICFFLGILLVLSKWAKVGMLIEGVGFVNLFGDFFPYLVSFGRRMPIIGPILNFPVVRDVFLIN